MRVLLVGDYPPPPGGVAVHVGQLLAFLSERGVVARVLDVGKGGNATAEVVPTRSAAALALRLARFSAEGWLVHLHTSGNNRKAWALAAAGLIAQPLGPGRLITIHSGLSRPFLRASLARRLAARAALAGYSRVIAVSCELAGVLSACGVAQERLTVCPAFIPSQVRPGPPPPGLWEFRKRHSPLLAFAHHPSPVYGRELMLGALRLAAHHLPGVGLAAFGPGTRSEEFAAAVRAAGLGTRVVSFGELAHPGALGLIARCEALVRPTTADGDSMSVREALALGVRCVASDASARPEGTVTFRSGDPEDLAEKLLRALGEPPPRVAAPDAGLFLLRLYEELAGKALFGHREAN
ncbi:MAG: glycosyltransferase family 4 protein [Myxococcales bacterium]|nr:glycosyltransferase family 4 protein [Myxococcales bacterium]